MRKKKIFLFWGCNDIRQNLEETRPSAVHCFYISHLHRLLVVRSSNLGDSMFVAWVSLFIRQFGKSLWALPEASGKKIQEVKMSCWISLSEWYRCELVTSESAGKKEDLRLNKWLLVSHFSILGVVLAWANLPESVWKTCYCWIYYKIKSGPQQFEAGETILLPSADIEFKKRSAMPGLGKDRIISTSLKCHIFTNSIHMITE